jgi:septum formation protein
VFHTAVAAARGHEWRRSLRSCRRRCASERITAAQIDIYLDLEQPFDCAAAQNRRDWALRCSERIAGDDPTALIGLPLMRLTSMLTDSAWHCSQRR